MDKKTFKFMLRAAYEAPKPKRKDECMRHIAGYIARRKNAEKTYMSWGRFFLVQAGYIRLRTWIIATLVFAVVLCAAYIAADRSVGVMSACMPFLALTVLIEGARSAMYGMEELEYATRFSRKGMVLSRMSVMSACHIILIVIFAALGGTAGGCGTALAGLYIIVPYFVTVYVGSMLFRRFHGKETGYGLVALSIAVSLTVVMMQGRHGIFYGAAAIKWWAAVLAVCVFLIAKEIYDFCGREEMQT